MKNIRARILNLALYISLCALMGTGLLLAFRLPPGSQGGRGLTFLSLDRHVWGDIHTWISYGFIALMTLHLMLHYKWLMKIAASNHSWRLWLGLLIGVSIVLFFILIPVEARF